MVDKSKRGIVGLVLIFLIVIGDLIVGFADSPSKPNTFTKALADTLYCMVSGSNCYGNPVLGAGGTYCQGTGTANEQAAGPNCSDVYCTTTGQAGIYGSPQCTSQTNTGLSNLYLQKTTKTAFTLAAFTSIVSGAGWTSPSGSSFNSNLPQIVDCTATFDFDTGVGTTIALFRIADLTNAHNSGYNMQLGPGLVLNSNETIAMLAEFSGYVFSNGTPSFAFQVSVSGAAGTITMGPGAMLCTRTQGDSNTASVG